MSEFIITSGQLDRICEFVIDKTNHSVADVFIENNLPEIVRCRDCEHFYVTPGGGARYCEKIEALWLDARDDGFCYWGERKDG